MIQLVTFADASMSESARLCTRSAAEHGVDLPRFVQWEQFQQTEFYRQHEIFKQPRGLGYWAWKPWVVLAALEEARNGDFVIYADAGVEIVNNVSRVTSVMNQDIHLFANQWQHAHWCKRDVVDAIYPAAWSDFGKQVQASVVFFRATDFVRRFVAEWLDWCLIPHLVDDSPSIEPNHPEFQEHRHDQAILTTMAYRDGINLHWWPAMYNNGAFDYPKSGFTDTYPIIFHHHRKRNHEWSNAA